MSEKKIGIVLVLALIVVCILSLVGGNKKEKLKEYTNISVEQYLKYYKEDKDRLILVGSKSCAYCKQAAPIIKSLMYKYNLDIYYVSTDEFTEETEKEFMESNELLNSFSTPFLFVISNGEIKDSLKGLQEEKVYIDFFKNNGFIK